VTGPNVLTNTPAADALSVAPLPPPWAQELASVFPDAFALTSVSISGINAIGKQDLERAVADAYTRLLHGLDPNRPHPLRIWNYLPRIVDPDQDGLDRYMRFNVGRYQAFKMFFGDAVDFHKVVPAASAVGHGGDELVIYALASRTAGQPITNPRQRAPYHYSKRFGPLPPCFARAMLIEYQRQRILMIGGTASVRGEDSVHVGDLARQLEETAQNLSALLAAAFKTEGQLSRLSRLRVYYVHSRDLTEIQASVSQWFCGQQPVEWLQADLCRPDLLVEIEGLAGSRA
jgi:enamine deaminase RidA (YjgF/YER057c/UK114 family)